MIPPRPRHQYAALDALRGVAAFAVLLYHAQPWFGSGWWFAHGYVAVDFFFVLSGFVIAHAYGDRLVGSGTLPAFVRDRAIRLYPMIVAGAGIGIVAYVVRLRANGLPIGTGEVAAMAAAIVPWPATWVAGDPWPVNPPIWSIFWELVVNLIFARTVRWWTIRNLIIFTGVAFAVLAILGWQLGGFGPMGPARESWALGGLRTSAVFAAGVLSLHAHRAGWLTRGGRRPWIIAALALSITILPQPWLDPRWYDFVLTAGVFPLLVLAAAGSRMNMPRMTRFGAELSYPLYAMHAPLLLLFGGAWARVGLKGSAWTPIGGLFVVGGCIAAAWAVYRWWDIPVRARLKARYR
ncbi:acyltransferase family protein [Sphingomonas sp. Leaf4]|uniref:acyltransferase family protein n=1 Tax=Sphingomonas sp. Leaf4 TaxID=2876553 RepID=UPI001E6400B3|nr:acyltransferase [Sphingomonas sp. Leaf4]